MPWRRSAGPTGPRTRNLKIIELEYRSAGVRRQVLWCWNGVRGSVRPRSMFGASSPRWSRFSALPCRAERPDNPESP